MAKNLSRGRGRSYDNIGKNTRSLLMLFTKGTFVLSYLPWSACKKIIGDRKKTIFYKIGRSDPFLLLLTKLLVQNRKGPLF